MKNTSIEKIRRLLKRKIVAARNLASKTNDYLIPLDCRYIVSMSIQELEQILTLLSCETCNGLKVVPHGNWTSKPCPDCQQNDDLKNVPYPICPINLYFEGDEDKCDVSKCDFDTETRMCSRGCIIDVEELQKELDKVNPGCTKGELRVLSDGLTIKAKKVEHTPHYDAEPPQTFVAKCFQNSHLGRTKRPTKEDLANAKELVRRWNAFEENGLVTNLLDTLEMAENWLTAISKRKEGLVLMAQACPYEADNHTRRKVQDALRGGRAIGN